MKRQIYKLLNKIYYNLGSSSAYAGLNKVFNEAKKKDSKITLDDVKEFLETQETYAIYKPARHRFKRLQTVPAGLHNCWQCDLAIFDTLYKNNDGYKYLLVCIDVLSRKIFVAPTKSKSSIHMMDAFDKIFKKSNIKPHKLYSDRGLEFQAAKMLKYFQDQDIIKQVVYSPDIHAGVVERANRTIKERLYRYFHKNNTHRWVDIIDKLVEGINNSVNRTTGVTPNSVTYGNAMALRKKVYGNAYISTKQPKFKVGDRVKMSREKGIFSKGYHPNYTTETFKITTVKNSNPPHYKLEDMNGENILGVFYEPELSKIRFRPMLWEKSI